MILITEIMFIVIDVMGSRGLVDCFSECDIIETVLKEREDKLHEVYFNCDFSVSLVLLGDSDCKHVCKGEESVQCGREEADFT